MNNADYEVIRPRLRTYTRAKRRLLDDDDTAVKRRRVELLDDEKVNYDEGAALASSPPPESSSSDPAISSDAIESPATPPSSPPQISESSFFSARTTLPKSSVAVAIATSRPIRPQRPKKRLVQMQLSLGQSFQRKCKDCGMEYVPSNMQDFSLHQKYHSRRIGGITLDKALLKKVEGWKGIEWRGKDGDCIISVTRHLTNKPGRSFAKEVLDVVQGELGAVDIPYNALWSLCAVELSASNAPDTVDNEVRAIDMESPCYERYKVYMYIHGTRCVGLCLAERIDKAHKVLGPEKEQSNVGTTDGVIQSAHQESNVDDSPIAIAEEVDQAWMGVSRIWTSRQVRKKGIAKQLLDCACKTFREQLAVPKHLVAFSQPTESGARLARKWFGRHHGWLVYVEPETRVERMGPSSQAFWLSLRPEDDSKRQQEDREIVQSTFSPRP